LLKREIDRAALVSSDKTFHALMNLTQGNLKHAEDRLAGLDILKSNFCVIEADFMVMKASHSKSLRLWTICTS